MRHADVDAQYDAIHIDSNEILLRHAVDGISANAKQNKQDFTTLSYCQETGKRMRKKKLDKNEIIKDASKDFTKSVEIPSKTFSIAYH